MLTRTRPGSPATAVDLVAPRLRAVLMTNATTSGLGGLAALVAGGPVDSMLGAGDPAWVRAGGAGLVAFAVVVAVVSRAQVDRMARATPAISVGDGAWVVGTIVTIALGWYSVAGAVIMAFVGAMVATFGVTQTLLIGRLHRRA